jgi:hypothetical protein
MIGSPSGTPALNHTVGGGYGSVTGHFYVDLDSGIYAPIAKVDPVTMREVARFGTTFVGGTPGNSTTQFVALENAIEVETLDGVTGSEVYLVTAGIFGELGMLNVTLPAQMDFVWLNNDTTDDDNRGAVAVPPDGDGTGVVWLQHTASASGQQNINMRKISILAGAFWNGSESVGVLFATHVITAAEYGGRSDFGEIRGPWYDQTDGSLIFTADTNTGNDTYFFKWSEADGVIWTQEITGFGGLAQETIIGWPQQYAVLKDGTFGLISGNNNPRAMVLDTSDGSIAVARVSRLWTATEPCASFLFARRRQTKSP